MTRRRSAPAVGALSAALHHSERPWPRAELEAQWSRRTLNEAIRLGFATRLAPGIYTHREHATDLGQRLEAVAQWMAPHGLITGRAALHLWGWSEANATRVDVALPRDVRLARPHYVDVLRTDQAWMADAVAGIPVTSPEDSLVVAWRTAAPSRRRGLMLDALRDAPVDRGQLRRRIDAHGRLPHRAQMLDLLALSGSGATTVLEHIAATEVFVGQEWREWERQGEVRVANGVTLHPDMLHRRARVAVELDGARYHSDDAQRRRDLQRDALLVAAGYAVIRFTWEDITRRPAWCRDRALAAVASRAENL